MAEKCRYAYRKRGKAGVFCKQQKGEFPLCGIQYMCPNSQRWEVNKAAQCTLRNKPAEQDK